MRSEIIPSTITKPRLDNKVIDMIIHNNNGSICDARTKAEKSPRKVKFAHVVRSKTNFYRSLYCFIILRINTIITTAYRIQSTR